MPGTAKTAARRSLPARGYTGTLRRGVPLDRRPCANDGASSRAIHRETTWRAAQSRTSGTRSRSHYRREGQGRTHDSGARRAKALHAEFGDACSKERPLEHQLPMSSGMRAAAKYQVPTLRHPVGRGILRTRGRHRSRVCEGSAVGGRVWRRGSGISSADFIEGVELAKRVSVVLDRGP